MEPTKGKKTVWFGMKLTPEEKEKLRRLSQKRGVSQKKVVLDLIEKEIRPKTAQAEKGSFLDGIEHLSGSVEGPGDLSVNPKYMEGFGK